LLLLHLQPKDDKDNKWTIVGKTIKEQLGVDNEWQRLFPRQIKNATDEEQPDGKKANTDGKKANTDGKTANTDGKKANTDGKTANTDGNPNLNRVFTLSNMAHLYFAWLPYVSGFMRGYNQNMHKRAIQQAQLERYKKFINTKRRGKGKGKGKGHSAKKR
jgi:hypothetical protein